MYGASEEDIGRVTEFARNNGLTVKETNAARRTVIVSGTVEQISEAFGVTLHALDHQEKFGYLDCLEVAEVSEDPDAKRPLLLRCGSHQSPLPPGQAELINKVQTRLKEAGYYGGEVTAISTRAAHWPP